MTLNYLTEPEFDRELDELNTPPLKVISLACELELRDFCWRLAAEDEAWAEFACGLRPHDVGATA
jgi:hypothetical protein